MAINAKETGDVNLDQLIDPCMLILSNASREHGLDVLLIAKNGVLDFYSAIKWSFHEFKDVHLKLRALERNVDI